MHLARTIEARLSSSDLARTLVERPGDTIQPSRRPSSGALAALEALRGLGPSLGGRIDMHHTIGEGGMGIVHLATQATLGRHVAVKTLRSGTGDTDATLRILREAWVTGALEHPNVVPVHDVGVDASGEPVIIMKRIEGRPWSALMHAPEEIARLFRATDAIEWNLRILTSVCNAVHFAHSRGILHRDLKPDNVMIGEFGEVYVVDWGIAVSLKDDPSGRLPLAAHATEIAGTPHYMAPEMLLGDPTVYSPRTDVYLLGAILFEIFAGDPPHEGDNLNALVSDILLSAPRFAPTFPPEARRLCATALEREPANRLESAEAFRVALDDYLRHRGSRKLAHDARQSFTLLEAALANAAAGEERLLLVANLLGECRFGYHAALSAWPENEAARSGLDQALLLVIEHELTKGSFGAAETLLRDVARKPPDVVARVAAAKKAREQDDARLKNLEKDLDPTIGTRTRMSISAVFGGMWTIAPVLGWEYARRYGHLSYFDTSTLPAILFLFLGFGAFLWGRESMSGSSLNRRIGRTFILYMVGQVILTTGAERAGVSIQHLHLFFLFAWALSYGMLAIWAEPWLALPSVVCGVGVLVASVYPPSLYFLMSLGNLLFTIVVLRVWIPREDLARILARRQARLAQAREWFHGERRG